MNLNNIDLPSSMVAGLYPGSLIESPGIPAKAQPEMKEAAREWKTLGENRKHILVIVDYPGVVYLPDPQLGFLTEILTACKLGLADIAILNLSNQPVANWKEINTKFKGKTVLLFGVEPSSFGLPMSFPHYQVQQFSGTSFLFSPTLQELSDDKLLKSKLWVCLKKMFGL